MRNPLAMLLFAACSSAPVTEPSAEPSERVVIQTASPDLRSVFELPPTVRGGASFQVTYGVWGSPPCVRHRTPYTSQQAQRAVIVPQLQAPVPDEPCSRSVAAAPYTITLSAPRARGPLHIELRGYRMDGTRVELVQTILVT